MAQPSGTSTLLTPISEDTFHFVNPANLNQAWGSIASQLGNLGVMGEHSSEHGVFTPNAGTGGRTGVGNLSNDNPNFNAVGEDSTLADGAQGYHATFQAARLGDPNLPAGSVESQIGPLFPELHGNASVDVLLI